MQPAREGRAAIFRHTRCVRVSVCVLTGALMPCAAVAQADVFSLEGLVVTASPTLRAADAVASHVTVLSGEDLRANGVRSLSEALRSVPGVGVVQNGSFGATTSIFLRGGESDHTLVLVDGVQVNQAGGGFDFAWLTTDNVERVEIVRGPSSALYGSDAVAGVIHVITRTGRGPPRGDLTFEAGSYGRRDLSADFQAGTDRAAYSASLSKRTTDGVLAFNNGHALTVLSGSARLRPDDDTRVGVTVRLTDSEYRFPTDGSGAVTDTNALTFADATSAQITMSHALNRFVTVDAALGLNETDGGTDDQQDGAADTLGFYGFTSLDHFRRASGELRSHVRFDRGVLTVGFEAEEESQRSFTESASEFGPSSGRSESQRTNRALFLHGTGEIAGVSFNVGGRTEDNERFGTIGTWQAGVSWLASRRLGTRLRAQVGTAIKEPTFFENYATGFAVGNPDLDPERSLAWEVGVGQELLRGALTARATFFDQAFEDLIQYTFMPPAPGDPNYYNIAAATSRGMEVDVALRTGAFEGGLAWTWLDTEVTDAGFDQGAGATFVTGEPLLRRPQNTLGLSASVVAGARVHVFARLSVLGARGDRDFSTFPATPVALPRYEVLSIGGDWTVLESEAGRPRLSITVRADNVLDERYQEVLGFQAPGRGLYVGVSAGLGERK